MASWLSSQDSPMQIYFILNVAQYCTIIYLTISLLKNIWLFLHFATNSAAMSIAVQIPLWTCANSVD